MIGFVGVIGVIKCVRAMVASHAHLPATFGAATQVLSCVGHEWMLDTGPAQST
jgi:hypothetical protein